MQSKGSFKETPKEIEIEQQQIITDEELLDKAKVNSNSLLNLTTSEIVKLVIQFAQLLSGFTFYKYEREYAERIVLSLITDDGETITGLFCRQSGKSFTSGIICPSVCIILPLFAQAYISEGVTDPKKQPILKFINGLWAGIYAPDYDRAAIIGNKANNTLSSDQAKQVLSRSDIGMHFPKKLSSYLNHLPRGSKIKVKSANKKVSIEGDTYHLLITDETQEISDYVLKKSMSPFLASTNGTTVHNGSTYHQKVFFYDICQLNKKKDIEKPKKKRTHFEYDYKVAQKYNVNYKKYIIKEKEKLGEFSDEFRMSYELYWTIEKGMFITEDFLVGHLGRDVYCTTSDRFNDHVIAIDIGKVLDSTVATVMKVDWNNPIVVDPDQRTVRYMKHIVNWLELQGDDYDSQFTNLVDFIDNYRCSILVIDATGVGAPIYDRFNNRFSREANMRVVPFVFTTQSKSDGYGLFARELLAERITFPNSPKAKEMRKQRKFVQQITSLTKEMRGAYLDVVPVDEEGHDDYCDSGMLCCWGVEESMANMGVEDIPNMNLFRRTQDERLRRDAVIESYQKHIERMKELGIPYNDASDKSTLYKETDLEQSFLKVGRG
jgi:hypothetical protein